MIDAIFATVKLKWDILSYYVTTKEKTKREESFCLYGLVLILFPKLNPKKLQRLKYNLSQLKLYVEEKTADNGGDTTKYTVALYNEKPSKSVNTGTSTFWVCNEINYWDSLPNELVEKILVCSIKDSGLQTCQTYPNIIQACKRLVYVTLLYLCSLK